MVKNQLSEGKHIPEGQVLLNFYASASIDREHIDFGLSICLFVFQQKLLHRPNLLIGKTLGLHISHEHSL